MTKDKESFIFHTSGSTGEPKVVKKSYKCVLKEAQDLAEFFKFPKDTVFVSSVTPEFMYGTTFTVMLPEVLGCFVEPERVLYPEDIKYYEKFVFVSTPSFLEKLAKYQFKFKIKPKMIISAGAPLKNDIFKYLQEISEGVTEIYGSTEAGVIAYRQNAYDKLHFFENVAWKAGLNKKTGGQEGKRAGSSEGKKVDYFHVKTYSLQKQPDCRTNARNDITISSPYFDEPELILNDELEFFEDGFLVKGRNDRIVKIQEKRISLTEVEKDLNSSDFIEKSYCLKHDENLCAAVVLNKKGRQVLEKIGKVELVKILKSDSNSNMSSAAVRCKKWRFLFDLPLTERGKINSARIKEIFSTNLTYPNIIDFGVEAENAKFDLIFPQNSNFFNGHFTGIPVLPGVVQLFFVKEFIKDTFNLDFVPQKVKKVKFSSIIKPDEKVRLTLCKTEKAVEYKFTNGDKIYSSGTFVL